MVLAVLKLHTDLGEGRIGDPKDWEAIGYQPTVGPLDQLPPDHPITPEEQKARLAHFMTDLLHEIELDIVVRPNMESHGGFGTQLVGIGLPAMLFIQLAATITSKKGSHACDQCRLPCIRRTRISRGMRRCANCGHGSKLARQRTKWAKEHVVQRSSAYRQGAL
jgi:hypothetical protein